MKHLEVLEWSMGYAWPVIVGFFVLIVSGVVRLINWDAKKLSQNIIPIDVQRKTYSRQGSASEKNMNNMNRYGNHEQNWARVERRRAMHSSIPRKKAG